MSRDSSTRSAARVTFSAHRQIPIRWRLAGGSALLTLVILCAFAGVVGSLITERIHDDFDDQVSRASAQLQDNLRINAPIVNEAGQLIGARVNTDLNQFAASSDAVVRLVALDGLVLKTTERYARFSKPSERPVENDGYRFETRVMRPDNEGLPGPVFIQYGRPLEGTEATIQRVRLFLVFGVLSGSGLALLAGLMVARRAMAPIAELTAAAREIEVTRDPGRRIPQVQADDEVAELAHTLDDMLQALDESRAESEAALERQREFVADASHELRTPLTSVLANLELLADHLEGEEREAACSALRSSQRMRRLVADLLLLARADAERVAAHVPTDVADILVEAAAELGALADGHVLSIDAEPAVVDGARDELHRLVLNLMENAIRHTPAGTHVRASVQRLNGNVHIAVEDDGPGIPEELRERVFERFVRGTGDRGGSSGLGLSIVRAVAERHGGEVELHSPIQNGGPPRPGTRFEVRLPAAPEPAPAPV